MKFLGVPSSGSIAGTTSSHNRAGQYTRNRRSPVQPVGTGRRAFIRAAFSASSKAWQALSAINQAGWTSYAASHPVTDALGQSILLTGHQMFVAVATQLQNVGAALPTVPPVSAAVFAAGAPTFTVVHSAAITLTPTGLGGASDFLLYSFSAPVSPGVSFQKTFWQAGHVAGNSVAAIVATTVYTTQFGPVAAGQKVFCKVTPVNQYGVTGTPNIITAVAS
jgi:hypothetical protein